MTLRLFHTNPYENNWIPQFFFPLSDLNKLTPGSPLNYFSLALLNNKYSKINSMRTIDLFMLSRFRGKNLLGVIYHNFLNSSSMFLFFIYLTSACNLKKQKDIVINRRLTNVLGEKKKLLGGWEVIRALIEQ